MIVIRWFYLGMHKEDRLKKASDSRRLQYMPFLSVAAVDLPKLYSTASTTRVRFTKGEIAGIDQCII